MRNLLKSLGSLILSATIAVSPMLSIPTAAEYTGDAGNGKVTYTNESPLMDSPFTDENFTYYSHYTTNKDWTVTESGWYRFYMIGAGGSGEDGKEGSMKDYHYYYYGAGGQAGGGGGIAVQQAFLNKGQKISVTVSSSGSTLALGDKKITGNSASGTRGGTASGGNIANISDINGMRGDPPKGGGDGGIGAGFSEIKYTQKQENSDGIPYGFGVGGDGGYAGYATSKVTNRYSRPGSGKSGTRGAVIIEKCNLSVENKPTLGVMQQPIKNSYLVSAYACSEPNMILPEWHGFENQGGYGSGGWANGKDETAPEPDGVTANLSKSGTEDEINWIVADQSDDVGTLSAGDMLWVSGYYRESSSSNVQLPLQFGGFFNADDALIPTTVVASYDTHIADGQWHPFFYIVKSNLPIKNAKTKILEWPVSSGNGSITINGLQVQHVSSGKLVSNAVLKWDAGEHDVAYFQDNGQSLGSGVTFKAPAIGEYTVYMKDTVTETELVRTIGVKNIIPLDPIITVSPHQEWHKDTATILLEKQGDDKDNDQITLWYSTHKGEDGKDVWELYSVPVEITEGCTFKAKAVNRSFESDPVEQVIQFDKTTPIISNVEFTEDAKNVTITGTDKGGSGFKGVYVNDVLKFAEENDQVAVFVPDDVYSLELQAVDGAGNKSDIRTESVPDVIPPTVDSCTFAGGGLSAVIKASDKGSSGLKGIYVNEQFYQGDTVDYTLPEGITTIEVQAEDNAGNKSDVKTETVPDNIPPVIESVEFSKDNKTASILLSDTGGSGVKGLTINGEFFEGSEITYTVPGNTKYLEIQAMDKLNNKSETMKKRVPGWSEIIDTITIKPVEFRENNTMATITAETSLPNTTVAGIYINDVLYDANPVIYKVPNGSTTLQIQAVNNEGDKSVIYNLDVPQWGGGVRITSVSFSDQNDYTKKNMEAYIRAVDDTGHNIQGIYVNGEYFDGDAITYTIAPGTRHLEVQAINTNGDSSEMLIKRVPGWSEVVDTLTIESVNFASSGIATITAASTDSEVEGIYVNDKFFDGNPILYTITSNTKTLKLQAENEEGDKSAVIYKEVTFNNKVPIVNSLAVNSVAFDDAIATVAATSTGADITGIYVNDKLYDGNPVLYPITSSTKTLKAQAVNILGERSPVVYKEVPEHNKRSSSTSKGKARISISAPDWTNSRKARVRISVSDKNGIDTVTASTSYGVEEDITDEDYIYITQDTTVTVEVLNDDGETTKKSTPIECFDHDAPTISVSQSDNILNIKATDRKSGVAKIYVNNKLYRVDECVSYTVKKGATSVNVYAEDNAGNKSDAIDYPLKKEQKPITAIPAAGAVTTVTPTPTPPAPTPEPQENDIEIEAEEDSENIFKNLLPEKDESEQEPEQDKKPSMAGVIGSIVGLVTTLGGGAAWMWHNHKKASQSIELDDMEDLDIDYDQDVDEDNRDTDEGNGEDDNVQNVDFKVS